MKRILILIILINLVLSVNSQGIDKLKKVYIESQFYTDWLYFRMKANPLLSYEQTHDGVNWKLSPSRVLLPEKMRGKGYMPDIKISEWGKTKSYVSDKFGHNKFWEFYDTNKFYFVEKEDGYTGVKRTLMTDSIIDIMRFNIYDSIFPYDNRFLAILKETTKTGDYRFTFHSGNVMWGDWKDIGYMHDVDIVGYIRGVQFGIENVLKFNKDFSNKIKQFRPDFPDYVYTCNRWQSLLTPICVIIGAPYGKEDQLVEYIYYTNNVDKTGDTDKTHYYEMRYILPTQIKSIKERRLEKRLLTDAETEYVLNRDNEMYFYIEQKEEPIEEIIIEE